MGAFCAFCGKPIVDGANFCVSCGKPVANVGSSNPSPSPTPNGNVSNLFTEPAPPMNTQNTYSQVPQQIQQVPQPLAPQYQNVQYVQPNQVMQPQTVNTSSQSPYVPNEITFFGLIFNFFFGGFDGRCRVLEFWLTGFLIIFLEFLFIGLTGGAVFYIFRNNPEFLQGFQFTAYIVGPVLSIINFLPGIMITTRRLHDLDMSGWYQLINLIPIVGTLFMLYVIFTRGTDGHNQYG